MKAHIIKERCAADSRICKPLKECPENAICFIEDENEPLGGYMKIEIEKCSGCGICVPLCCGNCIEIK